MIEEKKRSTKPLVLAAVQLGFFCVSPLLGALRGAIGMITRTDYLRLMGKSEQPSE